MSFLKRVLQFKLSILVSVLFLFSRVPSLGYDTFNTDVWKWKARSYNFLNSIARFDLAGTSQSYHPGVTLMVAGSLGVKVYNAYYDITKGGNPPDSVETILAIHSLQKFFVVLFLSFLIGISFHLLRSLHGLGLASLFFLIISTEPFFVGHSREFHLESMVAMLMFVSFLWLYKVFKLQEFNPEDPFKKKLLAFAPSCFFGALALITKSSALFIFPFSALVILFFMGIKNVKQSARVFSIWLIGVLVFFVILWPAMWVNPLGTLQNYIRGITEIGVEGEHIQLYFGQATGNPGISFYPLNLLLRLSPEVALLFIFLLVGTLRNKIVPNLRILAWLSLAFVFFYLIYLIIPTKKLDRYIIPLFPFLALVCSIPLYTLAEKLQGQKNLVLGVICCLFVYRIFILAVIHPNYLFYYSPLVGGPGKAIYWVEPKWALAGNKVGEYFLTKPQDSVVAFPEKYFTQLWPFVSQHSVIGDIRKDFVRSNYYVYPVWEDDSSQENRADLVYDGSVSFRGVSLYNVYKIDKVKGNPK